MTKPYFYQEATVDINLANVTIRLWIKAPLGRAVDLPDPALIRDLYDRSTSGFVEALRDAVPGLNAVQTIYFTDRDVRLGWVSYLVPFKEEDE